MIGQGNTVTLDVIALAGLIGAFATIGGALVWLFNLRSRFLRLEKHDRDDHEMLTAMLEAQFATLDGLGQLGANGKVTEAREKLRLKVIRH